MVAWPVAYLIIQPVAGLISYLIASPHEARQRTTMQVRATVCGTSRLRRDGVGLRKLLSGRWNARLFKILARFLISRELIDFLICG